MTDWKLRLRNALDSGDPDRIRQAAESALENTPARVYRHYTSWEVENQLTHLIEGRLDDLDFTVEEEDDGLRTLIEDQVRQAFVNRVFNTLVGDASFWSAAEIEIRAIDDDPFMLSMDNAVTTAAEDTIEEMCEDETVLVEVLAFVKHIVENAAAAVIPCAEDTR
jgi:hypothetical protein